MPGATMYNCLNDACTIGVRNYPDYQTGIAATAKTLLNGYYPNTLAGLLHNAPVVDDAEMAIWGTGGGAVRDQLEQGNSIVSNPIAVGGDDCGWNVAVALLANSGALQHITIVPGEHFHLTRPWAIPPISTIACALVCRAVTGAIWPRAMPRCRASSASRRSSKIMASATWAVGLKTASRSGTRAARLAARIC
jgi:hypothetical protein